MNATETFEIVAVVAVVIAAAAGVGLALLLIRFRGCRREQQVVLGSGGAVDIVEHVTFLDEKFNNVRAEVEDLTIGSQEHESNIDRCLSRVGIARFDPYRDLAERQSTAITFLDALEDGAILTTVVSRDFARMHVKLISEGRADVQLAPEDVEALSRARARGSAPFTVRPRVEIKALANEEGITRLGIMPD